jgi:type IV pilus assembly protein PilW
MTRNSTSLSPIDTDRGLFFDQGGMTLIELMIGGVVAVAIAAAGFTILTTTNKTTVANDQTVATQQNVRAAMDILSRDIKLAGFGMTAPVGSCATAIVPIDANPGAADTSPDSIRLLVPLGSSAAPAWTLTAAVGGTTATLNKITLPSLPAPGAVANMVAEAGGSLDNAFISLGGIVTAQVTSVSGNDINFAPIPPPAALPAGLPVYLLQCVTYDIGSTSALCNGGSAPCLRRNTTAIAANAVAIVDGIEDIQFAYACDGCRTVINGGNPDRVIDDQAGAAGFDQADFVTNSLWTTPPMTPDKIRLVQVTVVGRQTAADQGTGEANRSGALSPTAWQVSDHNHAQGVFVAADFGTLSPPYSSVRRRVLTRTVEVRNIGQ